MTPSRDGHDRSPAEILAESGWPAVQTALLQGLAHDLSGRAAAVGGLARLLRVEPDEEAPSLDLLDGEAERLGEAVELLRLLAGDGLGQPPEALALSTLLPHVLRLHARHRGLDGVETELEVGEDVPPVRVRRTLLVRALLLLLGAAGWAARRAGERRLGVRLGARDERAVMAIEVPGAGSSEGVPDEAARDRGRGGNESHAGVEGGVPGIAAAIRGVEELLAPEGARVRRTEAEGGGEQVELSLPKLTRRQD